MSDETETYDYTVVITETRTRSVVVRLEIPAGTSFHRENAVRAKAGALATETPWSNARELTEVVCWQGARPEGSGPSRNDVIRDALVREAGHPGELDQLV